MRDGQSDLVLTFMVLTSRFHQGLSQPVQVTNRCLPVEMTNSVCISLSILQMTFAELYLLTSYPSERDRYQSIAEPFNVFVWIWLAASVAAFSAAYLIVIAVLELPETPFHVFFTTLGVILSETVPERLLELVVSIWILPGLEIAHRPFTNALKALPLNVHFLTQLEQHYWNSKTISQRNNERLTGTLTISHN